MMYGVRSCYSAAIRRYSMTGQNSRIAGIATMRNHKGYFSKPIYIDDFYRFSAFMHVFAMMAAILAIPLFIEELGNNQ